MSRRLDSGRSKEQASVFREQKRGDTRSRAEEKHEVDKVWLKHEADSAGPLPVPHTQ